MFERVNVPECTAIVEAVTTAMVPFTGESIRPSTQNYPTPFDVLDLHGLPDARLAGSPWRRGG
ncbi:MAG: hypothetical protein H0T54_01150 [Geodermatophilaceae bacterium]|nr:hypothetical protein [Geodermatophilaceae bacterium]